MRKPPSEVLGIERMQVAHLGRIGLFCLHDAQEAVEYGV